MICRRGEYDFILSSHATGHATDVAGYPVSCEMLPKPGGVITMVVQEDTLRHDGPVTTSTAGCPRRPVSA